MDKFSAEFPEIQPKVISKQNLTFLRGQMKEVIANDSEELNKIDINFNIIVFSHSQDLKHRLDAVFEFYIDPSSNQIGLDSNLAFNFVYEKFNEVLDKALNECQNSKDFIGLKEE